ncbi:MAG: PD40 domain-containing protein [Acidobacteriia bacterium]|nr:PD40 domain-containing protein [Terriglobia bacterium]
MPRTLINSLLRGVQAGSNFTAPAGYHRGMAVLSRRFSRRLLLASALLPARLLASDGKSQKGQSFEPEIDRYPDEATELQVYRMTDPSFSSTLPSPDNRIISRNSATLLFASNRSGLPQAFRMNLKTGEMEQVTDRKDVDGASLNLLPDGRSFAYFAAKTLYLVNLGNLRERAVYTVPEGWELRPGLHVSNDGASAIFIESRGENCRVRNISLAQGTARTVLETPFVITDVIERLQRPQILYRQPDKALWLAHANGQENAALKLARGVIGPAHWSPDGKTLLYLNYPEEPGQLNAIREYTPESQTDRLVAKTSQYVAFSPNRDTSVFVGSSRNAASPAILIMLRVTRRELTLCEHRASRAETVAPLFAPDSQRIYFQSDRHGMPAIYALHVERLVERIEDAE